MELKAKALESLGKDDVHTANATLEERPQFNGHPSTSPKWLRGLYVPLWYAKFGNKRLSLSM